LIRDIGVGNAALTRLGAGQRGFTAHARPGFADRPGLLGAGSYATPAASGDVFKRLPAMKKIMSMALVRPYWRWVAHPVPSPGWDPEALDGPGVVLLELADIARVQGLRWDLTIVNGGCRRTSLPGRQAGVGLWS
jgi:hypothetical protein